MTKSRLIFTDEAGNTLWSKKLKNRTQVFAKNRQNKIVNEKGVAELMNRANYWGGSELEPTSAKGKRMMKYFNRKWI